MSQLTFKSSPDLETYIDEGYTWDFTHNFVTFDATNRYVYEVYFKGELLFSSSTSSENYCCFWVMSELFNNLTEFTEGLILESLCPKPAQLTQEEYETKVKRLISMIIHRLVVWSSHTTLLSILDTRSNISEIERDASSVTLNDSFSVSYKEETYLSNYVRRLLQIEGLLCEKYGGYTTRVYRG